MIFVGPTKIPVTGQSFSFHASYQLYEGTKYKVCYPSISERWFLARCFFFIIVLSFIVMRSGSNVYLTISRSKGGFFRDFFVFVVCVLFKRKLIVHLHGADFKSFVRNQSGFTSLLIRFMYNRVTDCIILLPEMRDQFDDFSGIAFHALANFHNLAVDPAVIENKLAKFKSGNKIRCVYFSNIMEEKGVFDAIAGVKICKDRGIDIQLRIFGDFIGGPNKAISLESRLNSAIKDSSYIEYMGPAYDDQKLNALIEADVMLLPTFYETEALPITLIEGMAAGLVIVTTNHNYLMNFISEQNGILVSTHSPCQIGEAIEKIDSNRVHFADVIYYNFFSASNNYSFDLYSNKFCEIMKIFDARKAK